MDFNKKVLLSKANTASFRDPNGFIFQQDGDIYRYISPLYKEKFFSFTESGFYEELFQKNCLIHHELLTSDFPDDSLIIKPKKISFISYPYEWSFSQLKDAALLTLNIFRTALEHNFILKDASAYNIQFLEGRPIFIDTLSFDNYIEGKPWIAYKQFCQHFLFPLAAASYIDIRMIQLLKVFIDGIPIEMAKNIFPYKAILNFGVDLHLIFHSLFLQKKDWNNFQQVRNRKMSKQSLTGLIESLENTISKLKIKKQSSTWEKYYSEHHSEEYRIAKKELVKEYLQTINENNIWDLGSNDGFFSRIAASLNKDVISFDSDPNCVENNYLRVKKNSEKNILPLLMDFTNPSSSIGWANSERRSLSERGPADAILALALIHHLAIANNIPLEMISNFFASNCKWLIIEFVPKSDPKVKELLRFREDIFPNYDINNFEKSFLMNFEIIKKNNIGNTDRILYFLKKR